MKLTSPMFCITSKKLRSKLHCQKGFNLILFSSKVVQPLLRRPHLAALDLIGYALPPALLTPNPETPARGAQTQQTPWNAKMHFGAQDGELLDRPIV